jgi:hypothetical protein
MIVYCLLKLKRTDQYKDAFDDLKVSLQSSEFWSEFFNKKNLINDGVISFEYLNISKEAFVNSQKFKGNKMESI